MSSIQIQTKSNGINFTSTQRLGIAALLVVASNVAIAEDKMNWAGPYVGVETGYSWVHDKDDGYIPCKDSKSGCSDVADNRANGALLGLNLGYNFLLSNQWLLGIGTEFKSYSADKQNAYSSDNRFQLKSSFDDKFSLLAKAGYLVNDKSLVYVNGGWTNAKIKRDFIDRDLPQYSESHKAWQDGWTAGLGGEYNFYQNLTAKIEYRYSDFGSESIYIPYFSNLSNNNQKQNTYQNEFTMGVAYHF